MFLKFLFLLFAGAFAFASKGNIWYQTFTSNSTGNINVITKGRFGFTFVSLSSLNLPNITTLVYIEGSRLKLGQIQGSYPELLNFPLKEDFYNISLKSTLVKTFGNLFNEVEANIIVPIEYISNSTIITIGIFLQFNIGYNDLEKPRFGSLLPKMNEIYTSNIKNETYTSVSIPSIFVRFEFSHFGATITYNLFYLFNFILCIIFRNYQPLKSKGAIPFFVM